jgi:starvation-inducible DNA-binding protein
MSIDEIAERIRQLGGVAHGSMKQFLEQSRLQEHPGELMDGDDTIVILTEDQEKIIRTLRQDINAIEDDYGDVGTADFLTAKLGEHEEMAWMLRSFMRKSDIQS